MARRFQPFSSIHHQLCCCLILAAAVLAQVSGQLQIISTEDNQPFSNPEGIIVGFASDLVVQVRCSQTAAMSSEGDIQWSFAGNGSSVEAGLKPFGTSQENGVLRVYPANVLTGNGSMFLCSDGNTTLNVTFDLRSNIFFLNPIPPSISVFDDRLTVCQVPDIPSAQVTMVNETNSVTGRDYFYCRVQTTRGTFRSRSVIVLPAPTFLYEPVNTTARPVNGSASAAFSCAVSPADGLIEIQWDYEMMPFGSGSGMGIGPGLMSGLLTNSSGSVTIVRPSGSGTSILVLEEVGNNHEGFYSCVAVFSDGTIRKSAQASLTYNRTSLGNSDVIILAPPTDISVTEGDTVILPCVGSRGVSPSFLLGGVSQTTGPYSLDLPSISASSGGTYTCQIGETEANVTVNIVPLVRPSTDQVSVLSGAPRYAQEIIPTATFTFFRCDRVPPGQWLRDEVLITDSNPNLRSSAAIPGIYQCVGVTPDQPETDYAGEFGSDFYLLVPAVVPPTITRSPNTPTFTFGDNIELTLNCSVSASPLPLLEWSRAGVSVEGAQAPTGFMETAHSLLTINITELGVGSHVFQCDAMVDTELTDPINSVRTTSITIQPLLNNISVAPETQTVVLDGNSNMTVVVNCSVVANPPPRFQWTRNGVVVQGEEPTLTGEMEFSSSLFLTIGELGPGSHDITCSATPDIENPTDQLLTSATISVYTPPTFIVNPQSVTVIVGDLVTLNCSAQSTPLSNITWMYTLGNGTVVTIMDDVIFDISSSTEGDEGGVATSVLSFLANVSMAGTNVFFCVADNNIVRAPQSNASTVTVQTPPTFTVNPQSVTVIVGDLITLNCSAQSTPLSNITWMYMLGNGTVVTIMDDVIFNISSSTEGDEGGVATSVLSFLANVSMAGTNVFFCVADNNIVRAPQSNASTVIVQSMPVFLDNPESTIAVVGDQITLNCSVEATPLIPTITWVDEVGEEIINDGVFTITSFVPEASSSVNVSRLMFSATAAENRTGNGSAFQCVATVQVEEIDRNLTEQSEIAVITIAGVPGSPSPVQIDDITSRSALVSWQPSFSLIDLINYTLVVYDDDGGIRLNTPIVSNVTMFNLTNGVLRPNRRYRVMVVAFNGAGRGEAASVNFTTSEDVPEGTPNITAVSSTLLQQIDLSWTEVDPELQNGNITNYTIRFFVMDQNGNGNFQYKTVINLSTALTADNGIEAGVTYNIAVAGNTRIGRGPFGDSILQPTLSLPPMPIVPTVNMNGITTTTIPVTLPSISGSGPDTFSHFWVIAMKYDGTVSLDDGPLGLFSNNNTFTLYVEDALPFNRPYIVAEIDATRISFSEPISFRLGSEETTASLNDVLKYRNGPLTPGTEYTVFLWGFPPSVPNADINKRQTQSNPRQYAVFTSSPFLSPVATATPPTDVPPGVVAGVVIAIILLCVAIVALVAAVMVYMRWKVKVTYIPPPSRKGSMRLRDRREVIQDSSTASLIKNQRAESELQQLTPDDVRLPVTVEEFPSYCKMMHANSDHLYSEEYEILTIKSPSLPHIQCSMPHNVHKNRYANINCYDESRVHLSLLPGVEGSDYINSNYIDGYQRKCAYVAAQGPLPNTTYDFWRMVWELNTCCVIMLTNLVEKSRAKCHQYWPDIGSLSLGDLTVTLIEVQQLAYYTIRTFRMSRGNDRREVKQFHYTGWPDFGVPDHPNPVISFIRRLANFKRTTDGPDVIHCSAGVGRTGTLISIQSMMQMMNEEGKIDIFNFVLGMRRQRNYMVQTERQYIFLHDAILELMKVGDTEIPIQSLRRRYKELQAQNPNTDSSKMETEFSQLNELEKVDESQFQAARMPVNQNKNRFQNILPYERYRVRLLLHPGVSGSDYMNASYIDGYQQRHQYIVTQGPLKDTVDDFWRMVWEHRASTIMMLCQLEEKGKEQCVRYWPNEKIRQHGDMFVELTQVTEFATYTMREFSITNTKINESRMIKQYQYTDWLEDQNPSNAAAIIDLIGVLQKSQHNNGGGPIIVHDSSSVGRSGTFCVMSSVLEQLKVEGIVDLFFTIHSLRQQQPGLVQTFDQYKFCYQAVIEFLDSFDHYANFD